MHSEDDNDDNTAPLWFAETVVGVTASIALLLVLLAVLSTGEVTWITSNASQVASSTSP